MENFNNYKEGSEIDEEECERAYQEYLARKQAEEEYEYELDDELDTGINAIDMTYLWDKRVEMLVDVFDKAIAYIKAHTDLTEDDIKRKINQCILQIEFEEEYSNNPNGVGYVDNIFHILSMNINILKEEPEYIYEFIKHEMTHMIGSKTVQAFLIKRPVIVSGYSRENAFDLTNYKEENEYFNEAAVEMFVYQDEEYRQEKVLDYTINTNQDLNGGIYCLNSNLIHQMLLARGIKEQEFFKGIYDFKKSKQIIRMFKKGIFKHLSSNMDEIHEELINYYDIEDEVERLKDENALTDVDLQLEEMKGHKFKLESIVSKSERMIIDKILLPRLKKMPLNERQQLLMEYDKFIISEREYFQSKTNYRAIIVRKKQEKSWLQHVDVKPLVKEESSNASLKLEDKVLEDK